MTVYNLGSLNIDYVYRVDHFVRPGETLTADSMAIFPGGKGLNQSVALARAGASVRHCGRIGQDGAFLREILREAGADVRHVETDAGPTGHALIQVEQSGQNCILLYPGTNRTMTEEFIRRALAEAGRGDILLLQNETNGLEAAFAIAAEKNMRIALNPSPFDARLKDLPLEQVSWWLCNEVEGAALTGETEPEAMARCFRRRYPHGALVLTLGGDGCLYSDGDGLRRQAAFSVPAVDTTAAGDTFTGYFLAGIAAGRPVEETLRQASAAAALAVSRPGASVSVPTMAETLQFLQA